MTPVIQVEHLRKAYGTKVAVDDVSLTVDRGEIVGILGPNGAGKTTTVECIAGLRAPDAGDGHLSGEGCAAATVHHPAAAVPAAGRPAPGAPGQPARRLRARRRRRRRHP